ncbi:alpha/beta fold hydrolase [Actinomadura xylanilytica]|uniref:alpha/beta fold hydrolase n=1 Tax=Actinomadura xylanilytica TaxID=887459 RepID=UPI00255B0A74|nr:alpha/beta hydrolase [Actinomadura xylanilytica]MDL4775174.1 alpha/beta hydrolase [Actinomadura xylanilytica]
MAEITTGTVTANGLEFAYLAAGPEDGPLALCLHGFPDSAHTWRHLMPLLAGAGYRVVAPFMRGYAPTAVPEDGAYQGGALAADAVALHEVLGGGPDAVLIGHDWGAFATYGAAGHAPGRWRKVVALAVPPITAMVNTFLDYEQLKRSFYMFLFQTPLAEMALDRTFVEGLWRDWSPGYEASEDVGHVMDCLAAPANIAAAIGYYRAMLDPSRLVERYAAEEAATTGEWERPILYLHGADDGCLGADTVMRGGGPDAVLAFLPEGSRAEIVPGGGHFLHLDRPAEVGRLIMDWIAV